MSATGKVSILACVAVVVLSRMLPVCGQPAGSRLADEAGVRSSANDHLQSLGWLIGEWAGSSDNGNVLVSSHWSDGGNFIVREFIMRTADGDEAGGNQRIGWDPSSNRIKCWSFDSQGGFGEGFWRHDGKSWFVESEEVLADGSKSATTTVYTPEGDGRFAWEVKRAKVGDVSLPMQRNEFVRAAQDSNGRGDSR